MSVSPKKFNALAAVKLMAAEDDLDVSHQSENKSSEQDDISTFLNVSVKETCKPIKGILKNSNNKNDLSSNPKVGDEISNVPSSDVHVQPLPESKSKEGETSSNTLRFVLKIEGLPFEMKRGEFVSFLGIWPVDGFDGIKVICDASGDPTGFAYVEVESAFDKMRALRATGLKYKNSVLQISSGSVNEMELDWHSTQTVLKQIEKSSFIRVGNLPFTMNKRDVMQLLHRYNRQEEDVYLYSDKPDHKNSGYCYVMMDDKDQAEDLCESQLVWNSRKLITRKIHPEVLSRWCKRNDIEMVVRKEIHYDMTVDLPAPRLQVDSKTFDSNVKKKIYQDPQSNVFVYDADNRDNIVSIESMSSAKDMKLIDNVTDSNMVIYDDGSEGKANAKGSKFTFISKSESKIVPRKLPDNLPNRPLGPRPFPFGPGPPVRPFLRDGMPLDPSRFPPPIMGAPVFDPRLVGRPPPPAFRPFDGPRPLPMPGFVGPRNMGPPIRPPTNRGPLVQGPNSQFQASPLHRPVYNPIRPHPPFPYQPGFPPTIFVRMFDVPERATTDDIKDFFHPIIPAKIAQNVGSDIYDVDFFNPGDAMTALQRSGLMIRKNVVKMEMLPGPFVPLPPRKIKSKKRRSSGDQSSSKRRMSPVSVHLDQPPPMPVASESSKPKAEAAEEPIVVAPFPSDPLEYHLKAFDPSIPEGQCAIQAMKGYFCQVCRKFYKSESSALVIHCRSKSHYDNTKLYLEKLKAKRDLS